MDTVHRVLQNANFTGRRNELLPPLTATRMTLDGTLGGGETKGGVCRFSEFLADGCLGLFTAFRVFVCIFLFYLRGGSNKIAQYKRRGRNIRYDDVGPNYSST